MYGELIVRINELNRQIDEMPKLSEMSSKQRITYYCTWARRDELESLLRKGLSK